MSEVITLKQSRGINYYLNLVGTVILCPKGREGRGTTGMLHLCQQMTHQVHQEHKELAFTQSISYMLLLALIHHLKNSIGQLSLRSRTISPLPTGR